MAKSIKTSGTKRVAKAARQHRPTEKQRSSNGGRAKNGTFLPGNSFGFKPGQSGNPEGRRGSIVDAIRHRLPKARRSNDGRTNAELLADVLFEEAIEGRNLQAVREILDRAEGKAMQGHDIEIKQWGHQERRDVLLRAARKLAEQHGVSEERALEVMCEARPELRQYVS